MMQEWEYQQYLRNIKCNYLLDNLLSFFHLLCLPKSIKIKIYPLTFENRVDYSLSDILESDISDSNILDNDVLDNKTYISLFLNISLSAQLRDLDVESIIDFNAIQSNDPPKQIQTNLSYMQNRNTLVFFPSSHLYQISLRFAN